MSMPAADIWAVIQPVNIHSWASLPSFLLFLPFFLLLNYPFESYPHNSLHKVEHIGHHDFCSLVICYNSRYPLSTGETKSNLFLWCVACSKMAIHIDQCLIYFSTLEVMVECLCLMEGICCGLNSMREATLEGKTCENECEKQVKDFLLYHCICCYVREILAVFFSLSFQVQ